MQDTERRGAVRAALDAKIALWGTLRRSERLLGNDEDDMDDLESMIDDVAAGLEQHVTDRYEDTVIRTLEGAG